MRPLFLILLLFAGALTLAPTTFARVETCFGRAITGLSLMETPAGLRGPQGRSYRSYTLGAEYQGEDALRGVHYLNGEQRAAVEVFVDGQGRLVNMDGLPITTHRVEGGEVRGRVGIFVMDREGRIFLTNRQSAGRIHHSSLVGGAPVASAGEIEVVEGVIRYVNRNSGHYRPPRESLGEFLSELHGRGVQTQGISVDAATPH